MGRLSSLSPDRILCRALPRLSRAPCSCRISPLTDAASSSRRAPLSGHRFHRSLLRAAAAHCMYSFFRSCRFPPFLRGRLSVLYMPVLLRVSVYGIIRVSRLSARAFRFSCAWDLRLYLHYILSQSRRHCNTLRRAAAEN